MDVAWIEKRDYKQGQNLAINERAIPFRCSCSGMARSLKNTAEMPEKCIHCSFGEIMGSVETKSEKHLSFFSCDSVTHEGETNTWFTPKSILQPLGGFDLDPCTQTFRPFDTAREHICEDAGRDGLTEDWFDRVWLNPPYGKDISKWLEKLAKHGNGIALVFGRMDTEWAQQCVKDADGVNFLKGRIKFLRADGRPSTNSGTGSMLVAYGRKNVASLFVLPGMVFVGGLSVVK